MTAATPMHEVEVLRARGKRRPQGWLTGDQALDLMLDLAIGWAADHAERCFLVLITPPPIKAKRMLADWADRTTTAAVAEMMDEGHRAAQLGGFTEAQLHRLQAGRAAVFDARLAELQAHAVISGSRA